MSTTAGDRGVGATKSTVVLGPEHDEALLRRLIRTLREFGAELSPAGWALGGSQEIVTREATLDGRTIVIECETYVGLSLVGDADLVARVAQTVKRIKDG